MCVKPLILYLHGFNSSPLSRKAKILDAYLSSRSDRLDYQVPALPISPAKSVALVEAIIKSRLEQGGVVHLVGSSLGGYYALHLAERYQLKSVLINPAIYPYLLLERSLGENRNFHTGEVWQFKSQYLQELRALEVLRISHPERFMLMIQTGDETLDYQEATDKMRGVRAWLEGGGNHEFFAFERTLPALCAFLDS